MTPETLVRNAKRLLESDRGPLVACWVAIASDREAFAADVRTLAGDEPVAAIVVRDAAFDDPNSLLQDLALVIAAHRDQFEAREFRRRSQARGRVCVVLVARRELGIPMASSPATLPDWFPVSPGETCATAIHDLTWRALVPLSAPEARVQELAAAVHEFERVMLLALGRSIARDHRAVNALFDRIRRDESERLEDCLREAELSRADVTTPGSFRPSVRDRRSLVARLWRLVNGNSPDQLSSAGAALASAIGIDGWPDRARGESMASVLARPSNPEERAAAAWGRSVLATLRCACQFVTAAAHADAYPEFPLPLVRATSFDLRSALSQYTEDVVSRVSSEEPSQARRVR